MTNRKARIKEILKFLSGFQAAHLLGHIILQLTGSFPVVYDLIIYNLTITNEFNKLAILYNTVIFLALSYFAYLRKTK